jgi:acyl carrier protein
MGGAGAPGARAPPHAGEWRTVEGLQRQAHLEEQLKASIAEVCGLDASGLTSATRLDAIGVDSLASAEVLVDLEIRIDADFAPGTLRRLEHAETIGDIAALLAEALAEDAPPAASSGTA